MHQMIYNTHSVKLWPGAQLVTDDLSVRDPYDDHALLDMCSRLPERLRRDGRLQRLYLSTAGAIGRLPNAKDRVRRSPTVLFARRRNRGTIGDYGLDLARESRPLLDLLLEDRTLDRGQLRREPVRRLIEQTDMGRGSRTRALGMLLTFEIFQRQFIDGDGFPAAVEHA
ncbi:MAG: hypothetical protein ACRDLR_07805 [Gaiellaceae bacterium]